jgi:TonB-linked SusC/RagA family outer membrane protein
MRKSVSILTLVLLTSIATWAQSKISGTVRDQNGDLVPFATVKVKGTEVSVAADANANFSIPAKSGDILVISAIGIIPAEITVGTEPVINALVSRTSGNISDVVVTTALGIKRQAKDLGYATTTISNKTLNQAKSVNIQQALNGKISGVNVSTVNSGVFENAKINIRGIRSLTGNNQPMLVVDGAPTPLGYLSSIPPDDVQSLTVLKSAASAAIYGPDAVNGVIVITTKRGGNSQQPIVTLSSSVQATNVSFFPKFQKEYGQGAGETVDAYGNFLHVPYENQQYGPRFDGTTKDIGIPLEDGSIQSGPYTNDHYNDKVKFWNTGLTWQNSISVASKDFYVSFEDAKIKGLVPDDENHRTSIRFNGGKDFGKLSVNYSLNYILNNFDVVNEAGFQNSFPSAYDGGLFFLVMQTASNIPLLQYKDLNSKFGQFSNYYNEYAVNPYWLIANIRTKGRTDNLIGNVQADYKVLPWMKATIRLASNLSFGSGKSTNAPVVVSDWAAANRNATQYSNRPGLETDDQNYASTINFDYYLSGDHDFSDDFSFKYIAGGSLRQSNSKDVLAGGNNLLIPNFYNVGVRSGDAVVGTNGISDYRLVGAYIDLGLGYKGWASVEFTGRNDWDSRLVEANRSFFYPTVTGAVVLSDAIPSLKNSNLLSYLKVFGNISKSGNVNLNPYSLQVTYTQPAGFPYGNTGGFTTNNTYPNPDLKPEFVNGKEIGVELGFLKNRISLNATYFTQKNTNQVLQISQSWATGFPVGLANAADFKNYGVEGDLSLTPLVNVGKGRIDFKMNATYNNNEVLSTLNNAPVIIGGSNGFIQNSVGSPTINNIAVVGMPAFAFQMTDYQRDPEGRVVVDGTTGLPTISSSLITKGRTLPLWVLGFTPSFSIGNFSFSMTWEYKAGNDFYSGLGSDEDFAGISARSAEYGRQRFVFPNSSIYTGPVNAAGIPTDAGLADIKNYKANTGTQVQDGNYGFWTGGSSNTEIATNYFGSAAAWRLREVNISYDLPFSWIGSRKAIKKITISAIGKNLLLLVPKSNQWGDPEFNYSTTGNTFGLGSSFQSPASRLFGGAITVQF